VFHHRAVITYRGTHYQGWQVQPSGKTIQGEINRALATISKSEEVRSIGSGRTDAGVHALGQVARLDLPLDIPSESLRKALNSHLPPDIRVLTCEPSHADFHPTYQAESKWYSYFFTLDSHPDPLVGELIAHNSFEFEEARARQACAAFEGTHDFTNFYTEGTEVASNVRTIFACQLLRHEPGQGPLLQRKPLYELQFHGNGFLKQMVRMMVGAIWNCSRGKIDADDIRAALSPQRVARLAAVAPPGGLYLMRVIYSQN
jgi:tRNA pseudouridine38-40 synthase